MHDARNIRPRGGKKNNGADLWAVVWHITCTRGRFSWQGIRTRLYYTHREMRRKSPTTTRWEKVASTETKEKTHTSTHARSARILHNIIIYYYKSLLISRSLEEINFCYARTHRASVRGGGSCDDRTEGMADRCRVSARELYYYYYYYWQCTAPQTRARATNVCNTRKYFFSPERRFIVVFIVIRIHIYIYIYESFTILQLYTIRYKRNNFRKRKKTHNNIVIS